MTLKIVSTHGTFLQRKESYHVTINTEINRTIILNSDIIISIYPNTS